MNEYEFYKSLMSVKDVARYLQVHEMTISRWTKQRLIPCGFKVGGQWRFKKEAIDLWIKKKIRYRKIKKETYADTSL